MLNLYRRHLKKCPHRAKGQNYTKCSCPIWCDGELNGIRRRQSLKTRDWQRAIRLAEKFERPNAERTDLISREQAGCNIRIEFGRCEKHRRNISKAIEDFLKAHSDMAEGTLRNYKRTLTFLRAHLADQRIDRVDEITRETIDAFRSSRAISALTWTKELEILRRFLRYCLDSKWTSENAASNVAMPKNIKPSDKEPYTRDEIIKILSACDRIGQRSYERLRARAMTLLLRYTALRIGDVATLAKDRVRGGEIYLRTMKNGKAIRLPLPRELRTALDILPEPIGTIGSGSNYFFWSGNGTVRSMVRDATRTMSAVFKASGVLRAHAHRFRHTLARISHSSL